MESLGAKKQVEVGERESSRYALFFTEERGELKPLLRILRELGILYIKYKVSEQDPLRYARDLFAISKTGQLMVARQTNEIERRYFKLLYHKLPGNNLVQTMSIAIGGKVKGPSIFHPVLHSLGENMDDLPGFEKFNLWLGEFFPKSMVESQIPQQIAGGNLMLLKDPKDHHQKLVVGEYSVYYQFIRKILKEKGEWYDFKDCEDLYKSFLIEFIQKLKKDYGLSKSDKVIILPQASYHLDLDMIKFSKNSVLMADYFNYLFQPKNFNSFIKFLDKILPVYNKTFNDEGNNPRLADLSTIFQGIKRKQEVLDLAAKILKESGVNVVRAPGNFPINAMYKNSPYVNPDFFKLFNFFNSIAVTAKDGALHLICSATFPELDHIKDEFTRVLKENGVTSHFVGGKDGSHLSNFVLLQVNLAGIHCLSNRILLTNDLEFNFRARFAFEKGEFALAKAIYEKAHEINPRGNKYLLKAAKMEFYLNNYQAAINIYQNIYQEHDSKKTHMILRELGAKAYEERKFERAKRFFLLAHQADMMGYECLSNAALAHILLEEYKKAIELMQRLIDKAAEDASTIDSKLIEKNQQRIVKCKKKLKRPLLKLDLIEK